MNGKQLADALLVELGKRKREPDPTEVSMKIALQT